MSAREDEDEPACHYSGRCQPHPEDEDERVACCRWCGGERVRDYPHPGNWGQLSVGQTYESVGL